VNGNGVPVNGSGVSVRGSVGCGVEASLGVHGGGTAGGAEYGTHRRSPARMKLPLLQFTCKRRSTVVEYEAAI
jgi:hypothetical protein